MEAEVAALAVAIAYIFGIVVLGKIAPDAIPTVQNALVIVLLYYFTKKVEAAIKPAAPKSIVDTVVTTLEVFLAILLIVFIVVVVGSALARLIGWLPI